MQVITIVIVISTCTYTLAFNNAKIEYANKMIKESFENKCSQKALKQLQISCNNLDDQVKVTIATQLYNCLMTNTGREQSRLECESNDIKSCTRKATDHQFSVLSNFVTHSEVICQFYQMKNWEEYQSKMMEKIQDANGDTLGLLKENYNLTKTIKGQQDDLESFFEHSMNRNKEQYEQLSDQQEQMAKENQKIIFSIQQLNNFIEDSFKTALKSFQKIMRILTYISDLQEQIFGQYMNLFRCLYFFGVTCFVLFVTSGASYQESRWQCLFCLFLNCLIENFAQNFLGIQSYQTVIRIFVILIMLTFIYVEQINYDLENNRLLKSIDKKLDINLTQHFMTILQKLSLKKKEQLAITNTNQTKFQDQIKKVDLLDFYEQTELNERQSVNITIENKSSVREKQSNRSSIMNSKRDSKIKMNNNSFEEIT